MSARPLPPTRPSGPRSGATTPRRHAWRAIVGLAVLALLGAACGTYDPTSTGTADQADAATSRSSTVAPTSAILGDTTLGSAIVGPDGHTLYAFTNDVDAISTCYGTCADAWPPVIVGPDWIVGPGLDSGIFATTVRDDGQLQLVAGKWPLYYYAGDAVPGDVLGQGSGDVWFLVNPAGTLNTEPIVDLTPGGSPASGGATGDAAPSPTMSFVGAGSTEVGEVLVDRYGRTLYGFTNDLLGVPSCRDDCTDTWLPVLIGWDELPPGLDPAVFSTVQRSDGEWQLVAGDWPLYRFAGDANPGEAKGHGSGGLWFTVDDAGRLLDDAAGTTDGATTGTDAGGYGY